MSVQVGDIVQISPDFDSNGFGACLMTVTEVKAWGLQGYVQIPKGGQAYYRVKHGDYEPTGGRAVWLIGDDETEATP